MKREKFKKFIKDCFLEFSFDYKDTSTLLQPRGSGKYDLIINDELIDSGLTFDELISTPFYDGKTILDISEEVEDLQEF